MVKVYKDRITYKPKTCFSQTGDKIELVGKGSSYGFLKTVYIQLSYFIDICPK